VSVRVKRVYEAPSRTDGVRVLVDRLWPRGLSKEAAQVDLWLKEIAPSHELRHWFGHDPAKWADFDRRYRAELQRAPDAVAELSALVRRGAVTLLFGSQELTYNNANALHALLVGQRAAADACTPPQTRAAGSPKARARTRDAGAGGSRKTRRGA
jgi:uncharacterized protein YeaO (DUF488 family)